MAQREQLQQSAFLTWNVICTSCETTKEFNPSVEGHNEARQEWDKHIEIEAGETGVDMIVHQALLVLAYPLGNGEFEKVEF